MGMAPWRIGLRFDVDHLTRYTYDRSVRLGEHRIRMHPRDDPGLQLLHYALEIDPPPAKTAHYTDHDGNRVALLGFEGELTQLSVRSRISARSVRVSPPPAPQAGGGRSPYSEGQRAALAPWLHAEPPSPMVLALADDLQRESDAILPFVERLNDWLYRSIERAIRDTGLPLPPDETLRRRRGACRDLTVLFIAVCRARGLAARFVSGYQHRRADAAPTDSRYMHAWPEVFVPGSGWLGFDPTRGEPVADAHLALAASARPEDAAPIEGSFFGDAKSTMQVELRIDVDEAD